MNTGHLDRLLAGATEYFASDLHLVAGVPPAYRVNGEIVLADEDALTEEQLSFMASTLFLGERVFVGEDDLAIDAVGGRHAGEIGRASCRERV